MKIDLKNPAGIRLLTGGRFCTENIDLAPALQSKTVTENGTVTPDEGYAGLGQVVVAVPVPEGYIKPAGTTYITANGEHDVTDYAKVSVAVPVPDGYVEPTGTKSVTSNGTHDVTNYAEVEVAVPVGVFPSGTATITANGVYDVTAYASVSVSTPVAEAVPEYDGTVTVS